MLAPASHTGSLFTLRNALLLSILVPGGLLAGAIGSQLFGGLYPCEMCIWQRWPHVAAVALGLLAVPLLRVRKALVALAGAAIATSGGIGIYHVGVELDIFAGPPCSAGGGNSLQDIMNATIVRCDAVQWEFLGVSMAGWNAIISLSAALVIFLSLLKSRA